MLTPTVRSPPAPPALAADAGGAAISGDWITTTGGSAYSLTAECERRVGLPLLPIRRTARRAQSPDLALDRCSAPAQGRLFSVATRGPRGAVSPRSAACGGGSTSLARAGAPP